MSRSYEFKNKRTGEEATGLLVIKGAKYPRGVEFSTTFSDALAYLANLGLTVTEWRVLSAMISGMSYGNFVGQTQRSIAKALNLADSNVSGAVKRLITQGLIAKDQVPGDPDRTALRVSPFIAWRGSAKEWNQAICAGEGVGFAPIPYRTPRAKIGKQRLLRAEDLAAA